MGYGMGMSYGMSGGYGYGHQQYPQYQAGGTGVRETGVVKSYSLLNGWGFIRTKDGDEAIVHREKLMNQQHLCPNDVVEFEVQSTPKGKRAINVQVMQSTGSTDAQFGPGIPMTSGEMIPGGGPRQTGTVKSFNPVKGFGFIFTSEGDEAVVFKENVYGHDLQVSEAVEFEVGRSSKGGKRAFNVVRYAPY
eukprot:NODE_4553_length_649_cov_77.745000_g3898_i0.p1 GENE.NODE_4553_length_649_cov_77.745000_g3898_i0~~NODE_4553_length_649_cov_77.745000_g3898_i0.p1  ORF type:complete len:201 (-),score=71.01 NODE_4553_length_649_cov_77.745000_g3898_i0:47-619(-)